MFKFNYISPSKLIGHDLCPYKQKNAKFTESETTKFGSAVDAGIEAWLFGGDFQEKFAETGAKNDLDMTPEVVQRALNCHAVLREASESWLHIEPCNILAVQADDVSGLVRSDMTAEFYGKKYWQVPLGGIWGLRGATDLIDWYVNEQEQTVLRVIDWKTGHGEADSLQLACYALMVWKLYADFAPDLIETRFLYLEQGGTSPSDTWTKETLVSAYKLVESKALAFIEAQKLPEMPRTTNKYCSYCEFKGDCPEYKQIIENPSTSAIKPYKPDDIADIAGRLEDLTKVKKIITSYEAELKEARETLLIKEGGEIIQDGYKYGIREITGTYEYDLPKIFEEASDVINRPPYEIMKFDATAYKKLMQSQDAATRKILKAILEDNREVKTTRLKFSKKITPLKVVESKPTEGQEPEKIFGRCLDCGTVHEFHKGVVEPCRKCKAEKYHLGGSLEEVAE